MSYQAGIMYHDRRPCDAQDAADLAPSITDLKRQSVFVDAGIVLVHHDVVPAVWLESCNESISRESSTTLTWDGRLDNRDELLLTLVPELGPRRTDKAIVSAALERWGSDALGRFVGDWSLACWNSQSETVTLARDTTGNRPLYYYAHPEYFIWSTHQETIVRWAGLEDAINEEYICGVLTLGSPFYSTPFKGVFSVPASQTTNVRRGSAPRTIRYWDFSVNTIRYARLPDYASHLRHLIAQAVQVRLRTETPVWAELSGGLDSSSLVAVAQRAIQARQVASRQLIPTSRVYADSPESDESPFIAEVERWCGLESVRVDSPQPSSLTDFNRGPLPFNAHPSHVAVAEMMLARGSAVLLSGELGDLVMAESASHSVALLEHLWTRGPYAFLANAIAYSVAHDVPLVRVGADLVNAAFSRMRSRSLSRSRLLHAAQAHGVGSHDIAEIFALDPSFVQRAMPEPPSVDPDAKKFSASKRPMAHGIYYWIARGVVTSPDTLPAVRITYPFAHRPLLEFVLAIPESVLWEPKSSRALMRTALQGIVPPAILSRRTKGYAPPAITRFLRGLAADLLQDSRNAMLVRYGFADALGLQHQLSKFSTGSAANSAHVRKLLAIEAWLRRRTSHDAYTYGDRQTRVPA